MPIYEYQCKNCDYHLEQLQKIDDKPLLKCPRCHQLKLSKLISKTNFQLKGNGWYVTDFKDSKKKQKQSKAEQSKQDKSKQETTIKTEKTGQNKNSKIDKNRGNNND